MEYKIIQKKWQWKHGLNSDENITSDDLVVSDDKQSVSFFSNEEDTSNKRVIVKLAIQAPQGSKFSINDTEFLIGRFGLLEFNNEDILINSVVLRAPLHATLNEEETQRYIEEGIKEMDQALIQKLQNTQATMTISKENINEYGELSSSITFSEDGKTILEAEYSKINQIITSEDYTSIANEQQFLAAYTAGYEKYIQGARGIYIPNDGSVEEVYNVLVDMVVKEEKVNE